MNVPAIKNLKKGPEAEVQEKITNFLRQREWYVRATHGNMFQSGFPDLYCSHRSYGVRWVEVKCKEAYSFTPAQLSEFPLMSANGTGIWILVDATEAEYQKLWCPPNWHVYLIMLNQHRATHL